MNDSDLSSNSTVLLNSTFNETQPTTLGSAQFAIIIPTVVQFILSSIALAAIVRIPALRKGENLFLTNLVIADLIAVFIGICLTVLSFSDVDSEIKVVVHAIVCKTFQAIWHFQFFWSMWGPVLIAYNRYSMVAHPFRPSITTRKAAIAIAFTCAVRLFIASLPFYTWAKYSFRYIPMKGVYTCEIDHKDFKKYLSFRIFYHGISYAVPVTLTAICFVMILQSVRAIQRNASVRSSSAVPSIVNSKTFWYVVVVVSTNAILPAPYIIGLFLLHVDLVAVGFIILRINFAINSVLYVFWVKTVSRSLVDIIRCRKIRSIE